MTRKSAASSQPKNAQIGPYTNILSVYPDRIIPRDKRTGPFAESKHPVCVGVLLLRCKSRLTGIKYLYKTLTEVEAEPARFNHDIDLKVIPEALEYEGDGLAVLDMSEGRKVNLLLVSDNQGAGPMEELARVENWKKLTSPEGAPDVLGVSSLLE